MTMQPSPPAAPAAPTAHTEVGVPDRLAKQIDEVNKAVEEAGHRAEARAAAAAAASGQAGTMGVVKTATGQIVVTGPDGKRISIDPKAGLNSDQIENVIQTALQPTERPRDLPGPSKEAVTIVAIIFTFLFLIALIIARTVSGRRRMASPAAAALPREAIDRLARIEQAVEAVAIEVERISEAQRYSAQLLTDRLATPAPPALARTVDASPVRG